MPEWSRNSEVHSSAISSESPTLETAFSQSFYRTSDSRTTQDFHDESYGQPHRKSRGETLSRRYESGGDEDFDAHYIPPQYDADQIAKAQNASQRLFGKTWENVGPEDIHDKIKSLTRQAKSTLPKEKRREIEIDQYRVGILASQKIDPQFHKAIFRRLDLITQNLAQE